jgi:phage baseplate assembly protein W
MAYIYKGFSTKKFQNRKDFVLTDLDLVKEDLINHIFTRRGERVKMADFGTSIPDLIFEPLVESVVVRVRDELIRVFTYDPRVSIVDMVVIPLYDEGAIVALVDLNYIELNEKDRMSLRIEFAT